MNALTRKRDLRRLRELPALTKSTICDELKPFAVQLGLTFSETGICFPEHLCIEQKAIMFSAYCENLYPENIPYDDVVIMDSCNNKVKVILRSGHIFHFIKDRQVWLVENALDYGEPSSITVLWWKISGEITLWWWKLTGRNNSKCGE